MDAPLLAPLCLAAAPHGGHGELAPALHVLYHLAPWLAGVLVAVGLVRGLRRLQGRRGRRGGADGVPGADGVQS